eukprot:TRINITY_DN1879_c0_g2_i4.p1 TRINITY_DN1879_c0_g2~~TRINITY_DN1879_c0_g2_i4.p1  ORF type:complete len:102 (+),score=31.13 TRINITY_DN1879_c0_g2_i4:144-449(+)
MGDYQHFVTLGIDPNCSSTEELRQAWKKLSRDHHPDKGGDPNAFIKIKRAYDFVSEEVANRESLRSEANQNDDMFAQFQAKLEAERRKLQEELDKKKGRSQ